MKIVFALYPGFTSLDFVGPYQVLSNVPGTEIVLAAAKIGPVTDDKGLLTVAVDTTLADVTDAQIIVVPGGPGSRVDAAATPIAEWLRVAHPAAKWTTSVCTGALILGAAGLLDGLPATTHWRYYDRLAELGALPTEQRVVIEGDIVTAAGVSSGIDMALTLVGKEWGDEVAQAVQLGIEYDPQPPYDAGSPSKAPKEIVELLRSMTI